MAAEKEHEREGTDGHGIISQLVSHAPQQQEAQQIDTIVNLGAEYCHTFGTGKSADPTTANSIIGLSIRGALAELYGEEVAQRIRVQYGGSVKPNNIADYMSHPDIDGALVGGASLKPAFVELVQNAV